jgi:predicted glycogen debranching enzyme
MNFLIKHGPGLTWMDVKINGKYVTPRSNSVEIQALWYNALKIMEFFASKLKDEHASRTYGFIATRAKESFLKNFWNGKYLKDTVDDDTIRPNQLIALNLPYRMLDQEKERKVLEVVEKNLLTKYGIRTLPKTHPKFHGTYTGNRNQRDEAYHQGTIWPWLLGLFVKAWIRIKKDKKIVNQLLKPFVEREIRKFGLGTLCEIIDGDKPFESKGCISQAWSIAEILDCLV